jgi:hypothetical protein
VVAVVAAALLLVGCSQSGSEPPSPQAHASPSPTPIEVLGQGCGSTPILSGGRPQWLEDAGAHNNPSTPYVIGKPAIAAGFLFGYPLTAGRTNPTNKILWVVGRPRNGSSLDITVHPVDAATPVVSASFQPDSGPGEIYPSVVDVPHPGCWYFDLKWAGNEAALDLAYA